MTIDIKSFTVDDLASWLENRPLGASFIDVREPSELEEQGTIKGYDDNIPYFLTNTNPELFEKQFSAINKDEQVLNNINFFEKCRLLIHIAIYYSL